MSEKNNNYDLVIIGSGAAGLSAAVYAGRYKLKILVFEGKLGGETATAGVIKNYPGFKSIDGFELMKKIKEQAASNAVEFKDGFVEKIEKSEHCFEIVSGKNTYKANSVILAQGTKRRRLGLPNEEELTGRGVHYCMTCDGPLYGGKTIAMVGGGDASVKGTVFAAEYAKKIYFISREKEITAEPVNLEQMKELGDKVEIIMETEVKEIKGESNLNSMVLSDGKELKIDGLFIEIGYESNTGLAKSLGVDLDEDGFIKTDNMMKTNIDGVFAAGDTVNHFGAFKQDITAAAMGAVAATSAYNDHQIHGELCPYHMVPQKVDLYESNQS